MAEVAELQREMAIEGAPRDGQGLNGSVGEDGLLHSPNPRGDSAPLGNVTPQRNRFFCKPSFKQSWAGDRRQDDGRNFRGGHN